VAYFLGTHGPTVTLETACSSSLVALAMACGSLERGDCDTAVVVGINFLNHRDFTLSLQACGVLVEGPTSHPFDEDGAKVSRALRPERLVTVRTLTDVPSVSQGFLRCEGAGAMVLCRIDDAIRNGDRVLCEVAASVAGSAGAAESAATGANRIYEQPFPVGMRHMFQRAFTRADLPYGELDYMGASSH
jgi:acyl transferase domain-containing protein